MATSDSPLARWALEHVGAGKFRSPREWSLAAGLNQNTALFIIERGRALPETVSRLARAAGESPVRAFIAAGWLREEDVPGLLPDEETHLLTLYRAAPERFQRAALAMLGGA